VLVGVYRHPFRQWTPEELTQIGVSKPLQFAPGTNWGYSHTNYVILGRVLEKIARMPLADAIRRFVTEPMGLMQTGASLTPEIPEPVLHAFSSERREALGVKPGVPFYEEATFWNPSWTTVEGAVETTNISDLSLSIEAVASGKLLSAKSSAAQIVPSLIGFGHTQPNCTACRKNTVAFNYGLGVINVGPWVTQTLGFAGASGAVVHLPARKLTIAVETTNGPGAYDDKGNAGLGRSPCSARSPTRAHRIRCRTSLAKSDSSTSVASMRVPAHSRRRQRSICTKRQRQHYCGRSSAVAKSGPSGNSNSGSA